MPTYSQMICLVGENPLPVYLGIMQIADLADSQGTVVLVHSRETKPQALNIRSILKASARVKANVHLRELTTPFDPGLVNGFMKDLRGEFPRAALNYTGGTKVMAGFGLLNWQSQADSKASPFDDAFYLEEGRQSFHFGSRSESITLTEPLTLATLRKLHGVNHPNSLAEREELTIAELARVLGCQRSDDMPFDQGSPQFKHLTGMRNDSDLYLDIEAFKVNLSPVRQARWHGMALPPSRNQYDGSKYETMMKCASGGWFEQLIERLVRGLHAEEPDSKFDALPSENLRPLVPDSEILANQTFPIRINDWATTLEFESDLLVINRQRLRYISITTSRNFKTCKSKMFEATVRSQQLGGGMANSCVICLGKDHYSRSLKKKVDFVDACRNALGNDPRHTIFGWRDVHDWVDGGTQSLRKFLTD